MKMKKLWLSVLLSFALFTTGISASEMTSAHIPDLGVTIDLPEAYSYIFTRENSEDDSLLEEFGVSKTELFENKSIYLDAFTENQNSEIIITMMQTDWSQMYYDFNSLSTEELQELAEYCLAETDEESEVVYSEYGVFEGNRQAQFLKAVGTFRREDAEGSLVQYVTVINGNAYTVTFDFYGTTLTDAKSDMTDKVLATISFENVDDQAMETSSVFYFSVIIILIVVIGLLIALIRHRKYSLTAGDGNREEKDSPQK